MELKQDMNLEDIQSTGVATVSKNGSGESRGGTTKVPFINISQISHEVSFIAIFSEDKSLIDYN